MTVKKSAQQAPVAPGEVVPDLGQDLGLPHERDESMKNVNPVPDPKIQQAKRDIDAGLVDTDMRVIPGLDAELREKMVPGPAGKKRAPDSSPPTL